MIPCSTAQVAAWANQSPVFTSVKVSLLCTAGWPAILYSMVTHMARVMVLSVSKVFPLTPAIRP